MPAVIDLDGRGTDLLDRDDAQAVERLHATGFLRTQRSRATQGSFVSSSLAFSFGSSAAREWAVFIENASFRVTLAHICPLVASRRQDLRASQGVAEPRPP